MRSIGLGKAPASEGGRYKGWEHMAGRVSAAKLAGIIVGCVVVAVMLFMMVAILSGLLSGEQ